MAKSNIMSKAQAMNEAAKIAALIAGGAKMKEDGEMKRGEVYAKLAIMGTFNTEDKDKCIADALEFVQNTDPDATPELQKQLGSYVRGFIKPAVIAAKPDYRKVLGEFRDTVPANERPKRSLWQLACMLNTKIGKDKPKSVDLAFVKATFPKPLSAEEKIAKMTPQEKKAAAEAARQEAVDAIFAAAQVLAKTKNFLEAKQMAAVEKIIVEFAG